MLYSLSMAEGGQNITFFGSITTAGVSLLGLACISSTSTSRKSSSGSILPWFTLPSRSTFSDWTIWIGSAWIVLRQHQPDRIRSSNASLSSDNAWQALSDFALVCLLLFSRKPRTGSSESGTVETCIENGEQKTSSISTRTQHFLQQIESNLGLTPRARNCSTRPDLELPFPTVMPTHGAAPHSSFPSSAFLQQQKQPVPAQPIPQQRFLELLVHNVSHTDLVLSLDFPSSPENPGQNQPQCSSTGSPPGEDTTYCLCRPRFSAFDAYSRRVLQTLPGNREPLSSNLISFPRYERSDLKIQRPIADELVEEKKLPIGFKLTGDSFGCSLLSVSPQERSDLRLRGREAGRLDDPSGSPRLNAAFFPLLAMLLPQWHARLEEKYGSMGIWSNGDNESNAQNLTGCKMVVILVSGVGTPRNWTHSMDGNSTEHCANLMERFIRTLYPDCVVVKVHSSTNIFRYDENISFVQNELLPCIQSWRDAHATGLPYPDEVSSSRNHQNSNIGQNRVDHLAFDPDWKKTMSVALSFADGCPSRIHAIQAALRPYKPTYFHCWQLKTFWHESCIVDSDIEVHSFEDMEALPPIDLTTPASNRQFQEQRPLAIQVVEEMMAFKADMESILKQGDDVNDLRSFWLRKTRKPVLAVLAVQMTKDGPVKLFRGTNMEVSMPTGSLCAERNVIGTALADNPSLQRHHLKVIAVLSIPSTNPEIPHTTSTASLVSLAGSRVNSRSNSIDCSEPPVMHHKRAFRSTGRSSSGEWFLHNVAPPTGPTSISATKSGGNTFLAETPGLLSSVTTIESAGEPPASPRTTPARRISLYQHSTPHNNKTNRHDTRDVSQTQTNKPRTVVVVQHPEDLNPLRPCGACNEWLKKIAETNPYFQILTFTDNECNGVYCTPCAE